MTNSSPPRSQLLSFWAIPAEQLCVDLDVTRNGLSSADAKARQRLHGRNLLRTKRGTGVAALLWGQFKSPIALILIGAAVLAWFLQDATDAVVILTIIVVSALLGFWQEYGAANALQALMALVESKACVMRDGQEMEIAAADVVPGDVIVLAAGATIPADCRLLEAKDLFVNAATLTGETFPVEQHVGLVAPDAPLSQRTNCVFCGTHVVSGTGRAVVAATGMATQFGAISERLRWRPPETEFEHGVRRFGFFLLEVTLLLVVAIFAFNVLGHRFESEQELHRYILEAFLFSLALAVGLVPQLLPAIISVNLAHGARRMAEQNVIVRRLSAIENFGSMDVLCSDKTGTLTEGSVELLHAADLDGNDWDKVRLLASVNARMETGYANPIDIAIRAASPPNGVDFEKLDEIPYDFLRKRLSILAAHNGRNVLITKGAFDNVISICSRAERRDGVTLPMTEVREKLAARFSQFSDEGCRTLAVAYRDCGTSQRVTKEAEADMVFVGFLVLRDPPKREMAQTIRDLQAAGISLKMVTGDNALVAKNVARQVGLRTTKLLVGGQIRQMSNEALLHAVGQVDVFAEVEPNQKERIILALKRAGHVVGYIGDGINDASALHSADVGISVDQAVDVAKEAADIVLLKHDLTVLLSGVREGRITFANTLKYVFMATSANFGNMFSMAAASVFLPFLPLLPKQVLLTNVLTDLPEMTIATDRVDEELSLRPRRWDIRLIRNFMLVFGLLSSVFDGLTFGILRLCLHADETLFRTGWFLESVASAALIVLVIRTRRPFFASHPSRLLLVTTLVVVAATWILPWTPLAALLGFAPVPKLWLLAIAGIIGVYVATTEMVKRWFYSAIEERSSHVAS